MNRQWVWFVNARGARIGAVTSAAIGLPWLVWGIRDLVIGEFGLSLVSGLLFLAVAMMWWRVQARADTVISDSGLRIHTGWSNIEVPW